jgi:type IX secretion system PorP/SprF family membrane protein
MKKVILLTALLVAIQGIAQQRGIVSNFLMNDYYYNPAIVGSKGIQIANLGYRNQWVGFDGAPSLVLGNFNGSVKGKAKHGYGVTAVSERTGLTQSTGVYLNYAYHVKISETVKLGLGVQPGFMQYRVRLYDAQLADENDEVLSGNVLSANAFDFNTGFNLQHEKFFLMGSIHHVLGDAIKFTTFNSNLDFHYTGIAGYNIKLKKGTVIQPSVLVKHTKPVPLQYTGMLKAEFKDKFWVGLLYRSDDAVGINCGLHFKERFTVMYGYDYTLSPLVNYQNGSHEIALSIKISKEKPSLEEEDDKLNNSILDDMKKEVEEREKNK